MVCSGLGGRDDGVEREIEGFFAGGAVRIVVVVSCGTLEFALLIGVKLGVTEGGSGFLRDKDCSNSSSFCSSTSK